MKKIRKSHPPEELRLWLIENQDYNHSYSDLSGTAAFSALKNKLLSEQGYLCAYTGIRISEDNSHIEHIKPQRICEDGEDVDYRNMLACFPRDGGDTSNGFGAPIKGCWWQPDEFISPLDNDCERYFIFTWSGMINPTPEDNVAAEVTIHNLALNHENLRNLRRSRISGFFGWGTHSQGKPLSKHDAHTLLRNIDETKMDGCFVEFCFMLKQLLPKYIAGES